MVGLDFSDGNLGGRFATTGIWKENTSLLAMQVGALIFQ